MGSPIDVIGTLLGKLIALLGPYFLVTIVLGVIGGLYILGEIIPVLIRLFKEGKPTERSTNGIRRTGNKRLIIGFMILVIVLIIIKVRG